MILVDANLLLYAEDALSPHHAAARVWWDKQLSGSQIVGLCWTVLTAYLRIATNPRASTNPLTIDQATTRIQDWLDQPPVRIIQPTENHWTTLKKILIDSQAVGNLVTDAHLAALAIDHGCQLCSTDADFARFKGLKWTNPLRTK